MGWVFAILGLLLFGLVNGYLLPLMDRGELSGGVLVIAYIFAFGLPFVAYWQYAKTRTANKAAKEAKKEAAERAVRDAAETARIARDAMEREEAKRQMVMALPASADTKWVAARKQAERGIDHLKNASEALADNRAAAFYDNLFGMTSCIGDVTGQVDSARAVLLSYETDRHSYQLPPPKLADQSFAPLVESMQKIKEQADRLFRAAERVPAFVQIRLQIESNREAAVYHAESLHLSEQMLDEQREIASGAAKMAHALDDVGERLDSLEDAIRESTIATVRAVAASADRQVESATQSAEQALEVARRMEEHASKVRDATHDIHEATIKPSWTNKYRP